jgi:hypothetical protein
MASGKRAIPTGSGTGAQKGAEMSISSRHPVTFASGVTPGNDADTSAAACLVHRRDHSPLRDRSRSHHREFRRRAVGLPATVSVLTPDGALLGRGTVRIANISASGALLTELRLQGRGLPVGGFLLDLEVSGGPQTGTTLRCRPVRPAADGMGVIIEDVAVAVDGHEGEGGKEPPNGRLAERV